LEGGLLELSVNMAEYFTEKLSSLPSIFPNIQDIRGLGLMIGMEFAQADGEPDAKTVAELKEKALEKGLILLVCGTEKNVIRFIPPLTVTKEELDKAFNIIKGSLEEIN
jgi:4-aminobutyrate aminotransferase